MNERDYRLGSATKCDGTGLRWRCFVFQIFASSFFASVLLCSQFTAATTVGVACERRVAGILNDGGRPLTKEELDALSNHDWIAESGTMTAIGPHYHIRLSHEVSLPQIEGIMIKGVAIHPGPAEQLGVRAVRNGIDTFGPQGLKAIADDLRAARAKDPEITPWNLFLKMEVVKTRGKIPPLDYATALAEGKILMTESGELVVHDIFAHLFGQSAFNAEMFAPFQSRLKFLKAVHDDPLISAIPGTRAKVYTALSNRVFNWDTQSYFIGRAISTRKYAEIDTKLILLSGVKAGKSPVAIELDLLTDQIKSTLTPDAAERIKRLAAENDHPGLVPERIFEIRKKLAEKFEKFSGH